MVLLAVRLVGVFIVGVCLGSLVNWAIYSLAWRPRAISPWSRTLADMPPRRTCDRIPVLGWFGLRRESTLYGRGHWLRPLVLEFGLGVSLAALYWWEVVCLGLVQGQVDNLVGQVGVPIMPAVGPLHWQFLSHALLLCWMLAASFIDIDEKIIPDEITVTGTLLGLVLAAAMPQSLLPHVAERPAAPVVGTAIVHAAGGGLVGPNGGPLWLEPVSAVSPSAWPPPWGEPRSWSSLAAGIGCFWLWCFALAPRLWRGRRGIAFALWLILLRVRRECRRPPLSWLLVGGTTAIALVWATGDRAWTGLLTALIGLVGSGGIVWAVRLIGTAALRREAMGFGDVTLMMMVGTFLGWQACLIAFFLAPFSALLIGVGQFVMRRDDVIPYGPFLCLASAGVTVFWAPVWVWGQPLFGQGPLVPLVLLVCLALLGVMLAIWQMIKTALIGHPDRTTDGSDLYLMGEDTEGTESRRHH